MRKTILKYLLAAFLLTTFVSGTTVSIFASPLRDARGLFCQQDKSEKDAASSDVRGEFEMNDYLAGSNNFLLDHFTFRPDAKKYRLSDAFYTQSYFIPVISPPPDNGQINSSITRMLQQFPG